MVLEQYAWSASDAWRWYPATLTDVPAICDLIIQDYQREMDQVLTVSQPVFMRSISLGIVNQAYNAASEQIAVARGTSGDICAWSWIQRGHRTTYSTDEIAEPKFAHVVLSLSARQRVRLLSQMIHNWERWCDVGDIPVIISNSIRADQQTFMRLHLLAGYTVRGSTAIKRLHNT
jgi:hypothetical protein